MNSLERAHTSCVMAQRMNNKAAREIENGEYNRAIKTLHNALRLSRLDFRQPQVAPILMLEACISHSSALEEEEDSEGVIYQQALQVPPQYMSHPMGHILPLLIMYNMALANQLQPAKENVTQKEKRLLLNRALKLYQLAYQWQNNNKQPQQQLSQQQDTKSLRFNMILINNIGEIHRCVNNQQKFQRCMQQLSRNMMFVQDDSIMQPMETLFRRHIQMSQSAAGAA